MLNTHRHQYLHNCKAFSAAIRVYHPGHALKCIIQGSFDKDITSTKCPLFSEL